MKLEEIAFGNAFQYLLARLGTVSTSRSSRLSFCHFPSTV